MPEEGEGRQSNIQGSVDVPAKLLTPEFPPLPLNHLVVLSWAPNEELGLETPEKRGVA